MAAERQLPLVCGSHGSYGLGHLAAALITPDTNPAHADMSLEDIVVRLKRALSTIVSDYIFIAATDLHLQLEEKDLLPI